MDLHNASQCLKIPQKTMSLSLPLPLPQPPRLRMEETQEEPIWAKVTQLCPLTGADAGHMLGAKEGIRKGRQILGWDSSQRKAEDTKD